MSPQKATKMQEPKPSRLEQARRIVGEYADDLREIIEKLCRKIH